jgi:V8-like Glu-specific endopeptidase
MDDVRAHAVFQEYATGVAYVAVETPASDQKIGSAFHVDENVWITARHVVEKNKIIEIGTTESSTARYLESSKRRDESAVAYSLRGSSGASPQ